MFVLLFFACRLARFLYIFCILVYHFLGVFNLSSFYLLRKKKGSTLACSKLLIKKTSMQAFNSKIPNFSSNLSSLFYLYLDNVPVSNPLSIYLFRRIFLVISLMKHDMDEEKLKVPKSQLSKGFLIDNHTSIPIFRLLFAPMVLSYKLPYFALMLILACQALQILIQLQQGNHLHIKLDVQNKLLPANR